MLYFVGVGPGDPELLTLKAARVLKEAEALAAADTGSGESAALRIVGHLAENKPILRLSMPMRGRREDWAQAHERAAQALLAFLEKYPVVAYPVLGDPSIYASSAYLLEKIAPLHPCRVIAGVPAMCAAAAELGVPLCVQGQTLTVADHFDALPPGPTVVMKAGRQLEAIEKAAAGRKIYLARRLGMEGAWVGPLEKRPDGESDYFTTALIQ